MTSGRMQTDRRRAASASNGTLARRSDFGHYTASSVTTLVDGLRCSTEAGGWTIASDLRPALGGEGSAPTPTVLVSAALGACLAMGYRLRAAEHGVELTSVRVTVETDSELRGMLAVRCGGPARVHRGPLPRRDREPSPPE